MVLFHAITTVTKGVSAGIGLAAEKYHDHKDRKTALAAQEQSTNTSPNSQEDDDDVVTDEQDDARHPLSQETSNEEQEHESERTVEELVRDSIATYSSEPVLQPQHLPYPIVIPQRRPGTKTRGFARAYPPDLASFGIEQELFLRFLKNFHSASQASPILHALSITASATSPIHGVITFAVSISASIALNALIEVQERYKANAFLDQMNKELFMPRGLYAMAMIYKPDNSTDAWSSPSVGIETINMETAKQISKVGLPQHTSSTSSSTNLSQTTSSSSTNIRRAIRNADGKTRGEEMMPLEVAPLLYPDLDMEVERPDTVRDESFKQRLVRNKKFVEQYFDRRAAAEYNGNNPTTVLASTTTTTPFRSRFADPNHPVNNGSIIALVSGGKLGHVAPGSVGWRETGEDGKLKPVNKADETKLNDIKNVRGPIGLVGYGIGLGLTGVQKVLSSNVMYLTVVNMPSEEELAEARKVLKENEKGLADLFRAKSR